MKNISTQQIPSNNEPMKKILGTSIDKLILPSDNESLNNMLLLQYVDKKTRKLNINYQNDNLVYKIWSEHLHDLLIRDEFIGGDKTMAEGFIDACLNNNNMSSDTIRSWINRFYLDHIQQSKIKIGILHTLSHLSYDEIFPEGQSIALLGLTDPDDEVIEFSIKAFENWEQKDSAILLKNRQIKKPWLQEYLNEVANYLEDL